MYLGRAIAHARSERALAAALRVGEQFGCILGDLDRRFSALVYQVVLGRKIGYSHADIYPEIYVAVVVSEKGQVVIAKTIRKALGIAAGSMVEFELAHGA